MGISQPNAFMKAGDDGDIIWHDLVNGNIGTTEAAKQLTELGFKITRQGVDNIYNGWKSVQPDEALEYMMDNSDYEPKKKKKTAITKVGQSAVSPNMIIKGQNYDGEHKDIIKASKRRKKADRIDPIAGLHALIQNIDDDFQDGSAFEIAVYAGIIKLKKEIYVDIAKLDSQAGKEADPNLLMWQFDQLTDFIAIVHDDMLNRLDAFDKSLDSCDDIEDVRDILKSLRDNVNIKADYIRYNEELPSEIEE